MSASSSQMQTATLAIASALVAHQIFRRYETFSIPVHAALLLGFPALVAASLVSHPLALDDEFAHVFRSSLSTYLATLALSIVVYRLSPFHPLAAYPGPWWAKISMLCTALVASTGTRSKRVRRLHDVYGDVFRIGPNELSIRDTSAIQAIAGPSGLPKGTDWIGGMLRDHNLPLIAIRDTDEHLRRRRAWNRGLGPNALREYEHVLARRAQLLVKGLEERAKKGEEVDLGRWFNWFGYDFMSDMAFGGGSELLREGDKNNVWAVLEKGMALGMFLAHLPWLGVYIGHIPGAAWPLQSLLAHGEKAAAKRLARGSTTSDLFHYLNNENLPEKPSPAPRQLYDDGVLAVVAGSDTTSSALTSVFNCLLTHPETYAKLQEEVDRFYPTGEDAFSMKHHRDMHYLQAVIYEALRLFPPVASGGSRRLPDNARGITVGLVYIPPGTVVRLPPWSIQRDPRNFTFPDAFWPERWLIASGHVALADAPLPSSPSADGTELEKENGFVHNEHAFIAFSHGPMNCPGKALALQEMRVVTVALVQRFRARLRADWDPGFYEREIRDYFAATRPCVPVILEARS
ncbi:high nitrogen upregulated cytochrome P450 monooxygenase 2 [Dichomitus squalens]|uniref:High nitrogen upregulated cytochrome P450 monooxygenase 2 n=1 Tax=Dichomitus squalens TaxID=114155 RepID=A0A4Q9MJB7_9APHY|nr:high nitrogen upregulated cytochrome P450 monooxygenase 2 [Dichomitus squalens]